MNIAFNTSSIKNPLTGLGRYSLNLAHALHQLKDCRLHFFDGAKWTDKIVVQPKKNTAKYRNFVRDHFPFAYPIKRTFSQLSFSQGITGEIDLYHEPNFLAFKATVPTVITVHDLSWIHHPEVHPASRVREMNRFFKRGLEQAQHIITDSEFIRKEFIAYFKYPEGNVTSIPLGVDTTFVPRSIDETHITLQKYALTHLKYFLVLGTLEPRKNLIVAINSFLRLPQLLRRENPLVIAGGQGWLDGDIKKSIAPLVASGEVRALGFVPQHELPNLLAGAKALIFPSIYEGFGLPPLEAMACGTPVIASNSSSIPEVVGDYGILLDPQDTTGFTEAMKSIIENSKLRHSLSITALERSKQFTWQKCAQATLKVYQRVLNLNGTNI